jgi:hypothetical protein
MNAKKMISHVLEGTRLNSDGERVKYVPTLKDARREIQRTRSAEPLPGILVLTTSDQTLAYILGLILSGLGLMRV